MCKKARNILADLNIFNSLADFRALFSMSYQRMVDYPVKAVLLLSLLTPASLQFPAIIFIMSFLQLGMNNELY